MILYDFFEGSDGTLQFILICAIIAVIIATSITVFNRKYVGYFVRRLFETKAETAESSKTLNELGFGKKKLLKFLLRDGSALRNTVISYKNEKTGEVSYYIPENKQGKARSTYYPDGSSVFTVLIAFILVLAVAMLAFILVPDLIQMAKNAIEHFS